MAKRLQVTLKDREYREIQRLARSRHMALAEWVRQALVAARRRKPTGSISKKLESIRIAARYEFPTEGLDQAFVGSHTKCSIHSLKTDRCPENGT